MQSQNRSLECFLAVGGAWGAGLLFVHKARESVPHALCTPLAVCY